MDGVFINITENDVIIDGNIIVGNPDLVTPIRKIIYTENNLNCKLSTPINEEDVKYICPHPAKQAYFLAFSQIRIQQLLKEILLKQEGMTPDLFAEFRREDVPKSEEILLSLGYRKVKKESNE